MAPRRTLGALAAALCALLLLSAVPSANAARLLTGAARYMPLTNPAAAVTPADDPAAPTPQQQPVAAAAPDTRAPLQAAPTAAAGPHPSEALIAEVTRRVLREAATAAAAAPAYTNSRAWDAAVANTRWADSYNRAAAAMPYYDPRYFAPNAPMAEPTAVRMTAPYYYPYDL